MEGRLAIVTDVGNGMRWTRQRQAQFFARTNDAATYGKVVWSWRSNAGAKVVKTLPRLAGDGGNQAWSPKSTKETVKTIAQGMPAVAVYPWLLTRVLFAAHAASGATRIRHSLRPLLLTRVDRWKNSDALRRENAASYRQSCRVPSFETPACGGLLRTRSSLVARNQTLVVRRRDSAVSNHEARGGAPRSTESKMHGAAILAASQAAS
jgi:hypothetical protein